MTSKNDFIFKEVFINNTDALADLLSYILKAEVKNIEVIKELEINSSNMEEKKRIIDLRVVLDNNEIIVIEMQLSTDIISKKELCSMVIN